MSISRILESLAEIAAARTAGSVLDDLSITELRRRQSEKWRAFPPDVLPAFVAEMDFPLAPAVSRAIIEAIDIGDAGYARPSLELASAFAGFAKSRFDWAVDPVGVTIVPDVMVGITELLRVLAKRGDGVVINPPVYPPFFSHIAEAGCRVVEAPLARADTGYQLDLDAVEAAFKSGVRVYLLCNPHNPTGLVLSRPELTRIAELADEYRVTVLADEIHAPLVMPDARHTAFLSLGEPATAHGIALVSASKGWNIPGLKCAQIVVASEAMRAIVRHLPEEMIARAGHLGVLASTAAYRDGAAWLDDLIAVLDRNRVLMRELLSERLPEVGYRPPQGTYLGWLDCRGLDLPEEPVDFFLKRGRVALGPGPKFGEQGRGFVRVTMATSAAILTEIVERMRGAVAG